MKSVLKRLKISILLNIPVDRYFIEKQKQQLLYFGNLINGIPSYLFLENYGVTKNYLKKEPYYSDNMVI